MRSHALLRLSLVLSASTLVASTSQWRLRNSRPEKTVTSSSQIIMGDSEQTAPVAARRFQQWRPQVHFSAPDNWLNDPNGLFRDSNGLWHMYYQYADSPGGDIVKYWGHTTSWDLLHWEDQPIAIPATARDGSIWSGSVVIDKNNTSALFPQKTASGADNVLAFYTSWQPDQESQHLAYSHDSGFNFSQYAFNPIISLNRHGFRDPKVSLHHPSGKWIMVLTLENSVTFYTSTNLRDWTQVSIWDPQQNLGLIECPQLLEVPVRDGQGKRTGAKWVLTLSLAGGGPTGGSAVKYIVGDFDGTTFVPDAPMARDLARRAADTRQKPLFAATDVNYVTHEIDFGPDKYATAFFHLGSNDDADHDAYSLSWATDSSYACCTPTDREGWRHCMNSVRRHWVDADTNRLWSVPAADESRLVAKEPGWNPIVSQRGIAGLQGNSSVIAASNPAIMWDLVVRVRRSLLAAGQTASAHLLFQSSSSGGTETVELRFDFDAPASSSSSLVAGQKNTPTAALSMARRGLKGWDRQGEYAVAGLAALQATGPGVSADAVEFTLHGVMDRSVMEVYVNGGVEAGTMLYFADGPLDSITLRRDGAADEALEFDFQVLALDGIWDVKDNRVATTARAERVGTGAQIKLGGEAGPTAGEGMEKDDAWVVGEL